jgi:hypothetical protein
MNVSMYRRIRQSYGVQGSRFIQVLTSLKCLTKQGAVDDGKNKEDLKRIPEELKNFITDGDEKVL